MSCGGGLRGLLDFTEEAAARHRKLGTKQLLQLESQGPARLHAHPHMLSTFSTFGTFYGANKNHAAFSRSHKDQSVFSLETSPRSGQSKANVCHLCEGTVLLVLKANDRRDDKCFHAASTFKKHDSFFFSM